MKNNNDLRNRLILFSVAVVLVPMIVLYSIILEFFTIRSVQENEQYSFHSMQSISNALDSAFSGINELSLYLIANQPIREYLLTARSQDAFLRRSSYTQANTALQFLPFSSKYYSRVTVFPRIMHSCPPVYYRRIPCRRTSAKGRTACGEADFGASRTTKYPLSARYGMSTGFQGNWAT